MAAHKIYGASNSVFSSDFMISRASRMLTEVFETTHISQIFSTILYNLVFVRLQKYTDIGRANSSEKRDQRRSARRHSQYWRVLPILHCENLLQDCFNDLSWLQRSRDHILAWSWGTAQALQLWRSFRHSFLGSWWHSRLHLKLWVIRKTGI